MGLLGLVVLQQFLVWLTAILSRVSLQTVLGEGFAPATTKATWRASLPMFWRSPSGPRRRSRSCRLCSRSNARDRAAEALSDLPVPLSRLRHAAPAGAE